jgi:MYXO-CTERM domain-containing protein
MRSVALLVGVMLVPGIAWGGEAEPIPTTAPWFAPRVGPAHAPDDLFHTPGTLFINFDGGDMQSCNGSDWPADNCSTIMADTVLPYSGDAGTRAAIVQAMANDTADFAVTVVGERPVDDDQYDMVMVGNWDPPPDEGGFAGVAPTIDCYNQTRGETSFSLDIGGASIVAKVVGQEAAHVWGLEHVDSPSDLLFPTTGGASDPSFEDSCHQIVVLEGGIQPTEAACAEMHSFNCPDQPNYQNSYQDMMMVFGPSTPDVSPPTLEILSPTEGEGFASGAQIELRIHMVDDIAPPLFDVYASIDVDEQGDAVGTGDYRGPELSLPINGLADGEHLIRVDVADQSGNVASDLVHFVIGDDAVGETGTGAPSGSEGDSSGTPPGGSDGDTGQSTEPTGGETGSPAPEADAADDGCGCRATSSAAFAPLIVLLLSVSRRRRRPSGTFR